MTRWTLLACLALGACATQPTTESSAAALSKHGDRISPKMLAVARRVRTEPGDLPRLRIKGTKTELPLKHTHVQAEVVGPIARVEVTQTYGNPNRESEPVADRGGLCVPVPREQRRGRHAHDGR